VKIINVEGNNEQTAAKGTFGIRPYHSDLQEMLKWFGRRRLKSFAFPADVQRFAHHLTV